MSAVFAIAEPRRIKASHRRRRKVTVGRFVQRYYDPAIGRFLSNDPVGTNPNTGASFNRYAYANNNPYRFYDPDGRYACSSARVCRVVADGLKAMDKSARALDKSDQDKAKQVRAAITEIGTKNDGKGPKYVVGELAGASLARTNGKETKIDLVQAETSGGKNEIAKALTHEATHDIDRKASGDPNDRKTFTATETNAYRAEQAVALGLGESISNKNLQEAIEASVTRDLINAGLPADPK